MTAGFLDITVGGLMNDTENLIARVKGGDSAAFRLIFDRHHRLVFRFLYGLVGEHSRAEELAQETFLRAYQHIGALKDETKLAAWLCGIAKNVAYNSFRAARKEGQTIEIGESAMASDKTEFSPDRMLLNTELNRVIRDALSQLDEDKRTVFTLKMLQQMSYEEIAEATGFSIPKLKSDLHRAKAEMRRLMRPYMEGEQ
jgi:RNA polymerase sigma-70 factor, ECF subfamily